GYTFKGWENVPDSLPAQDVTISGSYGINTYQITFLLDGEVFKTDSVVYAAPIIAPEVAEKEGHTFGGWQNVPETMPASDVTIEGSYIANKYMIIYLLDDEVFAIDSVAYKSEIVTLEAPEKEGYTFNGWENVPDSMPAQDVTIMGSYSINTYRLVYLVDDAIYYQDSLVYGSPIILIEEPVREGYKFSGWSQAPETMPAHDLTISGSFAVGLDAPMLNRAKCDVYSMDGKLLHRAISVEDLPKALPPGFYIVGDRKIVIK
ncbi:MAG: InlB B-repeat-containing protein, partial [Bacteroidales bacterium]|nr:InlB B-repeat-containing protein [Bacteroidales bacterium]